VARVRGTAGGSAGAARSGRPDPSHGGPLANPLTSELFISLCDPQAAPWPDALHQLAVDTRCTNGARPLQMPCGPDYLVLEAGPLVRQVHCLRPPTAPVVMATEGAALWRLINQLSLNYLTLLDADPARSAAALGELLHLHGPSESPAWRRQVEGLVAVHCEGATLRLDAPGPLIFGRGLKVALTFDERAFDALGGLVPGTVIERFLARQLSLNCFCQVSLLSTERGVLQVGRARHGAKGLL
jgi:type VI secretion system protein ImpG